jgi:copper oxidase (laccase) domain-containing protein
MSSPASSNADLAVQALVSGARVAANGVVWLPVAAWEKPKDWLWHGFSTRKGGLSRAYCEGDAPGELNLGFTASDAPEIVARNRRLFAEAVTGDAATPLLCLRQIHSSVIVVGHGEDAPLTESSKSDISSHPSRKERGKDGAPRVPECKGDGLMTDEPGVLLGIQTADCIPVLVADRKR